MGRPMKIGEPRFCQYCNTPLIRNKYQNSLEDFTRFSQRKYCDVQCMAQAMMKDTVTRSGYLYRAKKHRGSKCEKCESTTIVSIHHIDGNIQNNAPVNLMTLCASCHLKLHWANGKVIPKKPKTFCLICGKKAEAKGFCMNHYRHFMKYGDPLLTKKSGHSDGTIINEMNTELTD